MWSRVVWAGMACLVAGISVASAGDCRLLSSSSYALTVPASEGMVLLDGFGRPYVVTASSTVSPQGWISEFRDIVGLLKELGFVGGGSPAPGGPSPTLTPWEKSVDDLLRKEFPGKFPAAGAGNFVPPPSPPGASAADALSDAEVDRIVLKVIEQKRFEEALDKAFERNKAKIAAAVLAAQQQPADTPPPQTPRDAAPKN